jgi:23S rRNA-intervening sequence protein
MDVAKSFRDLRVYQLARKAVSEIFEISRGFPSEERYELTDQIRRSSMLARMIDRASDFCKYSPDTDYRETVNESPFIADDSFLSSSDGATP